METAPRAGQARNGAVQARELIIVPDFPTSTRTAFERSHGYARCAVEEELTPPVALRLYALRARIVCRAPLASAVAALAASE